MVEAMPRFRPWVILLVDDEPDILVSMKTLLEACIPQLRVVTAHSGRDGLDLLDRERVDLIISDFKMPGMDGIEFLHLCMREKPGIPRVMMTAFGSDELARRAVTEAMVDAFLPKSTDPDGLVSGITQLLKYTPTAAAGGSPPGAKTDSAPSGGQP